MATRNRNITRRFTTHRPCAARAIPASRVARVPHYDTAADVPADAPLGAHMTLPTGEPPPPGWTAISSSDDEYG
jgi:hypothetical protein